jgi:hypothetical protein
MRAKRGKGEQLAYYPKRRKISVPFLEKKKQCSKIEEKEAILKPKRDFDSNCSKV